MTTITTGHQRTPLIVALTASAALVVGGALGVAWEQNNNDTPAATQSHQTTPEPFGGATTSDEFSGSTSGSIPDTDSGGGATTTDEFSGSTSGHIPATGSPGGATTSQESTQ